MATVRTAVVKRVHVAAFDTEHDGAELLLVSEKAAADAARRARVPMSRRRRQKVSVDIGPEAAQFAAEVETAPIVIGRRLIAVAEVLCVDRNGPHYGKRYAADKCC